MLRTANTKRQRRSGLGTVVRSRALGRDTEVWMTALVLRWWQQSDHFYWISRYLDVRGALVLWRVLIAVVCAVLAVLAVLPVALLADSSQRHVAVEVIVSLVLGAVGVVLALLWLIRWPTRTQSILFSVFSTACVAAACLVQADPHAGLLGCTAFAVLGGYIALFHTAGYMLFNFVVAIGTTLILAARLAHIDGVVRAACPFTIVAMLNVAFPFAVQSLVHALGIDLRRANLDPLTGLLGRRAFYQAAHGLLSRLRESDIVLGVAVIDLDKFKQLNDAFGHRTGDQALAEVGTALRRTCRHTSVIGRTGGEEFVVADTFSTADLSNMAERIRQAVSALPYPVTASIGTASTTLSEVAGAEARRLIEHLIHAADEAMYEAKRSGGNQIRSAPPQP
jgi:diguanylate cyclase (GGDEF)-like protein